jgi:hypothetical protein
MLFFDSNSNASSTSRRSLLLTPLLPLLATATFALAAGCSDPTLATLTHRRLVVEANSAERVEVKVEYDTADGCADLDKAHGLVGTINGSLMRIETRGETIASNGHCLPILLAGPLGDYWKGGPVVIRIEDDSDYLEVEYADLLGERALQLDAPADGQIFVGDRIGLRWLQEDEDITPREVTFSSPAPFGSWYSDDVTLSADGLIEVTVPLVDGGDFTIGGGLRSYAETRPHPLRCEGAEACEASSVARARLSATATFFNHPRAASGTR